MWATQPVQDVREDVDKKDSGAEACDVVVRLYRSLRDGVELNSLRDTDP
jgi:hypothetical protein